MILTILCALSSPSNYAPISTITNPIWAIELIHPLLPSQQIPGPSLTVSVDSQQLEEYYAAVGKPTPKSHAHTTLQFSIPWSLNKYNLEWVTDPDILHNLQHFIYIYKEVQQNNFKELVLSQATKKQKSEPPQSSGLWVDNLAPSLLLLVAGELTHLMYLWVHRYCSPGSTMFFKDEENLLATITVC